MTRPKALRACSHCGGPFFASGPSMIYCSKRCKAAREKEILEEKRRRLRDAFLRAASQPDHPSERKDQP